MNDLTLPDEWRERLASYPREVVFAVLALTFFTGLVLLARRPRILLKGLFILVVVIAGIGAGLLGTRAGVWAGENNERDTVILVSIGAILLILALRARTRVKRLLEHRRLVHEVRQDPQKLLVLALAPEIATSARKRAVKLLDDPFTLDEIGRRARTESVKKLAKRRLARARTQKAATEPTPGRRRDRKAKRDAEPETLRKPIETPMVTPVTADVTGPDGEEILPESFYLPPDEER